MNLPPDTNTDVYSDKSTIPLRDRRPTLSPTSLNPKVFRRSRWPLLLLFVTGIVVGMIAGPLLLFMFSPDHPVQKPTPVSSSSSITVGISRSYLNQVVTKRMNAAGLPGNVSNVQVMLAPNNLVTISGDDQVGVIGLGVTKHFTITLQLSIVSCQLHATVIHADLAGIPVTGFVARFENQINQQLQLQQSSLPKGFVYCVTGVQTQSNQVVVVVSATPNT